MKQLIQFSVKVLVSLSLCLPLTIGCKTESDVVFENYAPYLEEITISDLSKGYLDGSFTIERVVGDYLKRIEKLDKSGPMLNSVIVVNPDALEIARALDRELSEGKVRGPMHGIPVILKDNLDTYDKMPTTAGAVALKNSIAPKDSRIAQMLREAGAVIIAKANLSEWANFRSKFSSSGWSGVGGQTKNPYILDRNPCGSSSGSAVAVSANLCALAIGTETNGSIVCPSNNNGIVGLKPTVGLLSRSGIIPISFTQDTPGPMGRVVADVAIALGVMTGVDSSDLKTLNPDAKFLKDYTQFLNIDGLKGKRIGRLKNISGYHHRVDTLMDSAVEYIKSAGAQVVDIQFPLPAGSGAASFQIMLYEFKDGLNKYFASLGESAVVKNMDELIAFNLKDSVELRYFDQNLLITANEKGPIDSPEYKELLDRMFKAIREDGIDKVMSENNLDLLIAPTGSPAWKTDPINGDKFMGGSSSYAAISGYPSITVPMGFIDRLPVGISFVGRAWSEPLLIEAAYSFEQKTKQRRAPQYFAK
ncbi:MAG: amidase [Bacteroidetes bacterium GWF2_41_61]|nr:MAG: amidase [Bacteroidetes bacterium GWF2_41_61]OFY91399.1 MAG: amidase [Bacteroidetes bacterium RIFOXYA12_FULL_40_10]HBG24144.1 amidase [Rikenellaceae bacterium]